MNKIYYYLSFLSPLSFVAMYFHISGLSDAGVLYAGLLYVYPFGVCVLLTLTGIALIYRTRKKKLAMGKLLLGLAISASPFLAILIRWGYLHLM